MRCIKNKTRSDNQTENECYNMNYNIKENENEFKNKNRVKHSKNDVIMNSEINDIKMNNDNDSQIKNSHSFEFDYNAEG